MDETTRQHFHSNRGIAALWFGVLGGTFAWVLQLSINYMATPYLCGSRFTFLPYVVSALMLGVALLGLLTAVRNWTRVGRVSDTTGPGVVGRSRMMAFGGVVFSSFFVLAIALQALPLFFLDPCRR